jgi:hypothetical protein
MNAARRCLDRLFIKVIAAAAKGGQSMKTLRLVAVCTALMITSAVAQNVEPSYKADPDVYKVIFENDDFRVIEAIRQKGVKDKPHSHPLIGVVYNLSDCKGRVYTPDGKIAENNSRAGEARAVAVVASHQAENIGDADCKSLFVEKKR